MSTVHLHLMLNHVPVVGTFFLIALFGVALLRRNATLTRTALWTWMALAAVSAVVFLTGEPAEEAVEGIAGISEGALERHEDLAKFAMIAMGAGGLVSTLALFAARGRTSLSRVLSGSGLAFSLLLAALMGVTANLGGQIRHTEIRDGASIAAAGEAGERGHDDDGRGR
jgi:uncharacterized membrane protein